MKLEIDLISLDWSTDKKYDWSGKDKYKTYYITDKYLE
jgi:hypothetical protein